MHTTEIRYVFFSAVKVYGDHAGLSHCTFMAPTKPAQQNKIYATI